MEEKANVLLVAPGSGDRDRIGGWLEEAGYEVLTCPGPREECDCVGLQGKRCVLAFGADVVVLDMGPGDDPSGPVLPGWRLWTSTPDGSSRWLPSSRGGSWSPRIQSFRLSGPRYERSFSGPWRAA
jgi:hypothetical protein